MENIAYDAWVYIVDQMVVLNIETLNVLGLTLGTFMLAGLLGVVALGALAVRAPGRLSRFVSVVLAFLVLANVLVAVIVQQSFAMDLTPRIQHMLNPKGVLVTHWEAKSPEYIYLVIRIRNTPRLWRIPWTEQTEKKFVEQEEAGAGDAKNGEKKQMGFTLRFIPSEGSLWIPDVSFQPYPAPPVKSSDSSDMPLQVQ